MLAALVIGPATAFVIVGVTVAALLNPIWVSLGQERAEAGVLSGYGPEELRAATGAILADLVYEPPDFDVALGGKPVLTERERGSLRDVRNAFRTLYVVVAVSAVVVLAGIVPGRRTPAFWRRVRRGGVGLAIVVLAGGLVGLVFLDAAGEAFRRLVFPTGWFAFDPERDRLVQLFPNQFWVETAITFGALLVVLGASVASWAGNRASAIEAQAAAATAPPRWTRRVQAPDAAPVTTSVKASTAETTSVKASTAETTSVKASTAEPSGAEAPAEPTPPEPTPAEPTPPEPTPAEPTPAEPDREATPRPAS